MLRRERIRLISLAPVRSSLEEYYIQKLQPAEGRTKQRQRGGSMNSQTSAILPLIPFARRSATAFSIT